MNPSHAGPRIALYSHDTMGFGHIRRNILLARALAAAEPQAQILLVSGIREAGAFALPPGVDSITLPAYRKQTDGSYVPRALGGDIGRLVALRGETIAAALRRFEPDLVVVDNVPRGAMNELDGVLPMLRRMPTRLVLGLRDVLDTPAAVLRQWRKHRNFRAIREFYDAVWVYGDHKVYDTAEACGFDADIRRKITALGYLDHCAHVELPAARAGEPFVLCMVGGGQDGFRLTEAFVRATLPPGHRGIVVTGSMMPAASRERLRELAAERPGMSVLEFVADPLALMRDAAAVVSMGGYNTTIEILALNKRALLVPRVVPRKEQWIRSSRLAALGLVDCLHPDDLGAEAMSHWLAHGRQPPAARELLDFNGLDRFCRLAAELISASPKDICHAA